MYNDNDHIVQHSSVVWCLESREREFESGYCL